MKNYIFFLTRCLHFTASVAPNLSHCQIRRSMKFSREVGGLFSILWTICSTVSVPNCSHLSNLSHIVSLTIGRNWNLKVFFWTIEAFFPVILSFSVPRWAADWGAIEAFRPLSFRSTARAKKRLASWGDILPNNCPQVHNIAPTPRCLPAMHDLAIDSPPWLRAFRPWNDRTLNFQNAW